MKHRDKVAIVTGGASGIGRACVERFIREGARVAIIDIDGSGAAELAAGFAGRAVAIRADLADLDAAKATALVSEVEQRLGGVDVLVNNAGIADFQPLLELAMERFDRTMNINLRAPLMLSQAAARAMVKAGRGGAIVNLASVAARISNGGAAAYSASKAAIEQLTKVMALELIPHGIRVNAVGPGTIKTAMSDGMMTEEIFKTVMSRTPIGRLGEADEIAGAISFLASDDASYVVGQTLFVDGGRLILNYVVNPPA